MYDGNDPIDDNTPIGAAGEVGRPREEETDKEEDGTEEETEGKAEGEEVGAAAAAAENWDGEKLGTTPNCEADAKGDGLCASCELIARDIC